MDKFSELKAAAMAATPGPWEWFTSNSMARLSSIPSGKDGDVLSAFRASDGVPCVSVSQYDMAFIAAANPAVVLELLSELEAKDKRIAELEGIEQKLCAANVTLDARASAAEAKLATPVRLPNKNDDEFWFGSTFQVAKFDRAVERAISAAGFKFVGDE
ncbi:ead/Ea22-like family protein [Serratia ureilytica]|uniref:ead/Ea22-like family protein n=1 Tax=Serratia ureilytica TaxID=300181 RepID=UPI001F308B5C|nr:ead/Ea22-like family protein [Serratia ureilytica]